MSRARQAKGESKLGRNFSRRLQRLEARVRSASDPPPFIINCIDEKGVINILLMESGKPARTILGGEPDNASQPPKLE